MKNGRLVSQEFYLHNREDGFTVGLQVMCGLFLDQERDTNLLTLQYFVNYNFDGGWNALTSPIMTADWEADSDHRWTVPIAGGFGKLFKIGSQPVTAQLSACKNVITADDYGPDWKVRAMMLWMFPRK